MMILNSAKSFTYNKLMPQQEHTHISITTGTILRVVLVALFLVLLYALRNIVIVFMFALVLASAISPFVNWLESKRIPRLLGTLFLYLMVFGLLALVVTLVIPYVSNDLAQLATVLPNIIERLTLSLDIVQQGAPKYFDFIGEVQNLLDVFTSYLQQLSQSAIGFIIGIFGGIFSFMAILVISFYLAVMKNGVQSFLSSIVPDEYEKYAVSLWQRAEDKVGKWLQGQLLLSLIVGLMVYVGLSIMDVKFALVFGLLAMVLEIVPVAGPVLAAVPAVIMAFIQGSTLGIWVIVFYTAVQQFENQILVPIVLGRTIGLNPVVVILALLIGGSLAGISGAILSVPAATIIVEILDDMAKHKELRRAGT